jgi:SAM-dependent methyltransferase
VKGLPGCELSLDPGRGRLERLYARVLGAPANGLRIRLRRVLPATRGDYRRILDAGAGAGVFSFELAKQHPEAQVLGVELDPQLVERANGIARRARLTNCRFEAGDVTRLEFEGEFDLVVSVDNFEHVEDDVTAMRQLWQALRPGGTLVAHVPAYERRWLLFGRRVNFDVPGHVRPGYRADELADKLSRAGFEIEQQAYTYGATETFTNNVSYLITRADRRNKGLYAIAFPALLGLSYFGKFSSPRWGAGLLTKARRPVESEGRVPP